MKFLVSYVHVLLLFLSRESIAFTGVEFDQRKHTCRTSSTRLDSLESHFFLGSRPDADLIAQSVPNTSLNSRHSASDWLYNVKSLPQSSVLREIKHPVLAVAGWSLVVSLFHAALKASHSGVAQSVARNICISGAPHSLLVSALGLLLVFRTNSAYQRFNVSSCGTVLDGKVIALLSDTRYLISS